MRHLHHSTTMKRGKKYRAVSEQLEREKVYDIAEALQFICDHQSAAFDESIEVHISLTIDPKKGDEQVRGTVALPHGTGKTKKIAVVTGTKQKDAKDAGADIVAGEELIADIKAGTFNFDVLVATPDMMSKLAPVAKILGPRGLMPSPKTETVTQNVAATVAQLKKGKVSFKNDKGANVHQVIGKRSLGAVKLAENYAALIDALAKAKPTAHKGKLFARICVCSTMGPSVQVKL